MPPKSALLVVDVQAGLLEPAHRRDEVIARINDLIDRARAADTPVVSVQHDGGADDFGNDEGVVVRPAAAVAF